MAIRFYNPAPEVNGDDTAVERSLDSLGGKKLLFLSNKRARCPELADALRDVLTNRYEIAGLTFMEVDAGRPEPKAKLAPLAQEYDAAIGAYGG